MASHRVRRFGPLAALCAVAIASTAQALPSKSPQGVINVATTTSVVSSVNPSTIGQPVTFTATVTAGGVGGSPQAVPTGNVTFFDGATNLGTMALVGGVAALTTSSLPSGANNVTAVYAGAPGFLASTSPVLVQTVGAAAAVLIPTLGPAGFALLALAIGALGFRAARR